MKLQKKPADKLPFHLQDALDKIKLPEHKKSKRGPVILGIILIHGLLIFALQEDMMKRAKAMFRPEIVYVTIIPPALPPAPSAQASTPATAKVAAKSSKTASAPAAATASAPPAADGR